MKLSAFHYLLLKEIIYLGLAVLFPPIYFLLSGKWKALLVCLAVVYFFPVQGIRVVAGAAVIGVLLQIVSAYRNRDVLEYNRHMNPISRWIGKTFGLWEVRPIAEDDYID